MTGVVHGPGHNCTVPARGFALLGREESTCAARLIRSGGDARVMERGAQGFRRGIDTGFRRSRNGDHLARDCDCRGGLQRTAEDNSTGQFIHGMALLLKTLRRSQTSH